uniref:Glucagon-like n=1 Tax=Geotrypetes seraphini TaxID=260995 RepID=A0A6P8QUS8_GEOSA|nr:glucagon-like [Geotrypetes seraphini]XP_033791362.1 glucagon-like [Geotrypetes seraphini]XP_033791363.1 glucagon-like [Geotrypetes seraphini]
MKNMQWIYLAGILILLLTQGTLQITVRESSDEIRWQVYKLQSAQRFPSKFKRHSEGTFTSDLTRHLDRMKAKDFIQWLMNTKRFSVTKRFIEEEPEILPCLSALLIFRSE